MNKKKLNLSTLIPLNGAVAMGRGTRRISLSVPRWNYAASLSLSDSLQARSIITVDLKVNRGTCGVGLVGYDGSTFLFERICGPGHERVVLHSDGLRPAKSIIFRSVDKNDSPLDFEVAEIVHETKIGNSNYAGLVATRDYAAEQDPGRRSECV